MEGKLRGTADRLGRRGTYLAGIAVLAGAYYGAAKLGFDFAFETPSVTAVWPPTGLALAALVLWGLPVLARRGDRCVAGDSWTGFRWPRRSGSLREHARGARRGVPAAGVRASGRRSNACGTCSRWWLWRLRDHGDRRDDRGRQPGRDRRGRGRRLRVGVARVVAGRHGRGSAGRPGAAGRRHWAVHARAGRAPEAVALASRRSASERFVFRQRDEPRVSRLPAADLGGAALLATGRHGGEPRGRRDRGRLHERRLGPLHGEQPRRQPAAGADVRRRVRAAAMLLAAVTTQRRLADDALGHIARTLQSSLLPSACPRSRGSRPPRAFALPNAVWRSAATSTTCSRPPTGVGRSSSATSAARARRRLRSPRSRATRCAPPRRASEPEPDPHPPQRSADAAEPGRRVLHCRVCADRSRGHGPCSPMSSGGTRCRWSCAPTARSNPSAGPVSCSGSS